MNSYAVGKAAINCVLSKSVVVVAQV